ncbi:TIGR00730 family Rossman fold protein [Candidatus Microgenomates bacterium]|nr:TIGR00730 family Rossman fold protein [Candidatus Microgenomates bacterium]
MNICVFCSAYVTDPVYVEPAQELARLIAAGGHNLVWGGSYVGIMKVMADGVRQGGGKIYGVSLGAYRKFAHKSADEMVIAKDLGERKAAMLKKSDAILVLPGGIGTIDELTDIIELRKQGLHDKPIVILNIGGFYDGLQMLLARMEAENFVPVKIDKLVVFAKDAHSAMAYIKHLDK